MMSEETPGGGLAAWDIEHIRPLDLVLLQSHKYRPHHVGSGSENPGCSLGTVVQFKRPKPAPASGTRAPVSDA